MKRLMRKFPNNNIHQSISEVQMDSQSKLMFTKKERIAYYSMVMRMIKVMRDQVKRKKERKFKIMKMMKNKNQVKRESSILMMANIRYR